MKYISGKPPKTHWRISTDDTARHPERQKPTCCRSAHSAAVAGLETEATKTAVDRPNGRQRETAAVQKIASCWHTDSRCGVSVVATGWIPKQTLGFGTVGSGFQRPHWQALDFVQLVHDDRLCTLRRYMAHGARQFCECVQLKARTEF